MFPRIAIHTGNTVDLENKHSDWIGTISLQHNETTATILKYGPKMKRKTKKRHPLLSTFQSDCEAVYWVVFNSHLMSRETFLLGQFIVNGKIAVPQKEKKVVDALEIVPPITYSLSKLAEKQMAYLAAGGQDQDDIRH